MLLGVEFGKLFRRKFNYLFLIILVLINLAFVYKLDKLATYYDMSILNIIFNIIFRVYYVIVIACFVGIIFLRKRNVFEELKTLILNVNTAESFAAMLVLLFVFANLIFLLALTLFNNTNLAISFSLLYFIGGEVIANMIKSRFSVPAERVDNSVLTIFTKSFNLLNQNITFSLGNFLPLVLNMLGLIVVIVIVRLMKKIIG